MGGRIWAESVENEGSIFYFTIVAEAALGAIPLHEQGAIAQLTDKRLLIVDDNETNRHNLVVQAETWGLQALATASVAEAHDALRSAAFDFVIVDSALLGAGGIGAVAALREAQGGADLSIIVISSIGQFDSGRSRELGISAALTKPVKPSDLHDAMMAITGSLPQRPEPPPESRLDSTLGCVCRCPSFLRKTTL